MIDTSWNTKNLIVLAFDMLFNAPGMFAQDWETDWPYRQSRRTNHDIRHLKLIITALHI